MRTKLLFLTIFTTIAVLMFFPGLSRGQNLISDPDFEGTGQGQWLTENEGPFTFDFDSTDTPNEGSQCLHLTNVSANAWQGGVAAQEFSVTAGEELEVRAWMKIPVAISAQVFLEVIFKDAGGGDVGNLKGEMYENTVIDWTEVNCYTNSIPASAVKAVIRLVVLPTSGIGANGSVYFDTTYGGLPDYPYQDNLNVTAILQLPVLAVEIIEDGYDFGLVGLGSTNQSSTSATVTNAGTAATYSLNLINPADWTASQTAPGNEIYLLNAAFNSGAAITWNIGNHALSDTPVPCSATKFAGDETGVNVSSAAIRHLWLQFQSPTDSAIESQQSIQVMVTAQAP